MRFRVPAGTRPSKCSSCGAEIFWIEHQGRTGKTSRIPVSIDAEGRRPQDNQGGEGISHFADCPNADKHRRNRTR